MGFSGLSCLFWGFGWLVFCFLFSFVQGCQSSLKSMVTLVKDFLEYISEVCNLCRNWEIVVADAIFPAFPTFLTIFFSPEQGRNRSRLSGSIAEERSCRDICWVCEMNSCL